jgi:hypothetical protein
MEFCLMWPSVLTIAPANSSTLRVKPRSQGHSELLVIHAKKALPISNLYRLTAWTSPKVTRKHWTLFGSAPAYRPPGADDEVHYALLLVGSKWVFDDALSVESRWF